MKPPSLAVSAAAWAAATSHPQNTSTSWGMGWRADQRADGGGDSLLTDGFRVAGGHAQAVAGDGLA
jgi:hypothetical protein